VVLRCLALIAPRHFLSVMSPAWDVDACGCSPKAAGQHTRGWRELQENRSPGGHKKKSMRFQDLLQGTRTSLVGQKKAFALLVSRWVGFLLPDYPFPSSASFVHGVPCNVVRLGCLSVRTLSSLITPYNWAGPPKKTTKTIITYHRGVRNKRRRGI
jgi:hypothetical protein